MTGTRWGLNAIAALFFALIIAILALNGKPFEGKLT